MGDVVADEGRNKEIGMVVAFLHAQGHGLIDVLAGTDEPLRLQLIVQELVVRSLIDQNVAGKQMP